MCTNPGPSRAIRMIRMPRRIVQSIPAKAPLTARTVAKASKSTIFISLLLMWARGLGLIFKIRLLWPILYQKGKNINRGLSGVGT